MSGGGEVNGWLVVGLIICGIAAPFSIYLLYKNLKKAEQSQTNANSDDDRDPEVLKKQLMLSVVICAALILVISLGLNSGSGYINRVRNSYFTQYSTEMTIGETFDSAFTNPQWSSRTLEDRPLVDFDGVSYIDGEPANVRITFNFINGEANLFFISINGEVVLNPVYESDLLASIYEFAE